MPPKKGAPRATNAQMDARLKETETLMANCAPRSYIISKLTEQYGLSDRAVEEYITAVYKKWEEQAKLVNVDQIRAQHVEMAQRIYNAPGAKAADKNRALNTLMLLCGTAMPLKTENLHDGKIEVVISDFRSQKK